LLLLVVVPITVQSIRPTARQPRCCIQQPDVLHPDTLESGAKKERKCKKEKKKKTTTRRRKDDGKGGVGGKPRNAKSTIIVVVALENTLIVFFFFIFLTVQLYGCVERLIVLEHSGGVSGELFLQ
jgi:hypothetical protein